MAFGKKGAPKGFIAAMNKGKPAPKRIGGAKGTTPMGDSTQPPVALAKGGMANCYADGGRVDAMCFNNGPGGAKNYKK